MLRLEREVRIHRPLEPPSGFVDEQSSGSCRRRRHLHTFAADGSDTVARDDVEYSMLGGRLVDRPFVRRDLERIFDHRARRILELLPG